MTVFSLFCKAGKKYFFVEECVFVEFCSKECAVYWSQFALLCQTPIPPPLRRGGGGSATGRDSLESKVTFIQCE